MTDIKPSIAICMATYNGDTYLSDQLDSLISQDYKNISIYIHDDGSTDNTVEILNKYYKKYPSLFNIITNNIQYKNAGLNFMFILSQTPKHDFYMFCDQDDVWLHNKVSLSLSYISKIKNIKTIPALCHSDLKIVDSDLNIICESMWNETSWVHKENSYESLFVENNVTGCTVIFNHIAKASSLNNKYPEWRAMLHDWWIALNVASINGTIVRIKEPTILYRQHENNSIGYIARNKTPSIANKAYINSIFFFNPFFLFKQYRKYKKRIKFLPTIISYSAYMVEIRKKYLRNY